MTDSESTEEEAIEMYVGGLVLDPSTQAPVVILKDESGGICLPIWIGAAEATSIASALKQVGMVRPLTHDLMYEVMGELGASIERIIITELRDSTYYAELVVSVGDKIMIFDSRPSDAIALAVRAVAPVFVSKAVLDQAKIIFTPGGVPEELPPTGEDRAPVTAEESFDVEVAVDDEGAGEFLEESDLRGVGKEKLLEILEELDPDDFKYKM